MYKHTAHLNFSTFCTYIMHLAKTDGTYERKVFSLESREYKDGSSRTKVLLIKNLYIEAILLNKFMRTEI